MCGITGIWNRSNLRLETSSIERFTDSIAHRGPDGFGYYHDDSNGVALGHRRLSILDKTTAGKQPMSVHDHLWITYNGEIFNFLEIREELEQLGFQFKSNTDTEVFLAAYKVWGIACFKKFNGMWAAGIYDQNTKELLLVRDRYGIKPLYYIDLENKLFAFASETIAFKNLNGFKRGFDEKHLNYSFQDAQFLEGQGKTIFKNIKQVKSGHCLKLTPAGTKEIQWWEPQQIEVPSSYQEQVEHFQELFEDACALRMRSDVPIASALSGGLDSSSVYATLHKVKRQRSLKRIPEQWQNAYTLIFPGSDQDEHAFAQQVVSHVGGQLNTVKVNYRKVDDIVHQTKLFDSIYDNPNFILVSLYQNMRADGVKVSLDGHGVDELLFGYPEMLKDAKGLVKDTDIGLHAELETMIDAMRVNAPEGQYLLQHIRSLMSRFKKLAQKQLSTPTQREQTTGAFFLKEHVKEANLSADSLNEISHQYFYDRFLPSILRNFDRASMQAGVEVRMPFMDYRLVDFIHSLPFESKLRFPFNKRILRDAMAGALPDNIRLRKTKIGLVAPMDLLLNQYLKEFAMDMVNSKDFIESPFWDGKAIQQFAQIKSQKNTWNKQDAMRVWPYLNAYLIQ